MLKKLLFLMVTVYSCYISPLHAQDDRFVPGYYITSDQDTIHGFIEDRYQIQQARSFRFKAKKDTGTSQEFTPSEVAGFFYEPNFYYTSLEPTILRTLIKRWRYLLISNFNLGTANSIPTYTEASTFR